MNEHLRVWRIFIIVREIKVYKQNKFYLNFCEKDASLVSLTFW